MKHYLHSSEEVFNEVSSSETGLSQAEADARLERDGKNKLQEAKKTPLIVKFFKQLLDPMIIILLVAAVISLVTTLVSGENEYADFIIIMVVVLLNALLGVIQESKAENAIAALQEMTASTCKVLRDGQMSIVKSQDVVVGDVVMLEAGDSVPADCRLFECASVKAEEAALTGESVPSNKTADTLESENGEVPLGDRKNMVYMGSTIVYGRGTAVVTGTGMNTEMGKIAGVLAQAKDGQTPLQKKMGQLSKVLTFAVIGICLFIFFFKMGMEGFTGPIALESFIVAISLAVAAIPEGLATVVTIVLSIGVTNMSKKSAVIRKLTAVETLGCAQIICSDKTGTLTQNKMTVVESATSDEQLLARAMALCSDAQLKDGDAVGEPTECALVNFANAVGLDKNEMVATSPRVGEAPFDSMRKMMSTIHNDNGQIIQYTKGAPDEVLKCCTHYLDENGNEQPITDGDRANILQANKDMADKALRVLCGAYRKWDNMPSDNEPTTLEQNLVYIGLTGMIDPIRPEVKDAIVECRRAGIRPIMITGDHIDTAIAIAMDLGIITDKSQATTGASLDDLSDEELESAIEQYSVYARVQPEHKVRIVNAWKAKGMITAMTGDGVNDAPSIKSADIGIGMGITGTDVTKNTADMVLADDNFATIVTAVGEGRRIYDNIRKAIQFLLSSNLAEVVAIFIATMMGFTLLKPAHLLWINLITDTFPAIALGVEKAEPDLMDRKPRSSKAGIFSDGLGINVILQGITVAAITLGAYFIGHVMEGTPIDMQHLDSADGMTMAFLAMSMTEIFHSYNVRSQHKSIFTLKSHNKVLWIAMVASLLLTTAVIFIPGLNTAFGFTSINAAEYFVALALAFSIIPIVEVTKLIQNAIRKSKAKKLLAK